MGALQLVLNSLPKQKCVEGLQQKLSTLKERLMASSSNTRGGTFEWVDSLLVKVCNRFIYYYLKKYSFRFKYLYRMEAYFVTAFPFWYWIFSEIMIQTTATHRSKLKPTTRGREQLFLNQLFDFTLPVKYAHLINQLNLH